MFAWRVDGYHSGQWQVVCAFPRPVRAERDPAHLLEFSPFRSSHDELARFGCPSHALAVYLARMLDGEEKSLLITTEIRTCEFTLNRPDGEQVRPSRLRA